MACTGGSRQLILCLVRPVARVSDSRSQRAAEIQDSIRQILRRDWDPIGLGDLLPEDEYDSYIAPVYRILAGSRSERELVDFLFGTERDTTDTSSDSAEQLQPVARRLLELDVRL